MTKKSVTKFDSQSLNSKASHDAMLAMPVRDGFCRYYGSYVPLGGKVEFDNGAVYTCSATETFTRDE